LTVATTRQWTLRDIRERSILKFQEIFKSGIENYGIRLYNGGMNEAGIIHPGERLKELLDEKGWMQSDLAFILGLPDSVIHSVITGKRNINPQLSKALAAGFASPEIGSDYFAALQTAYNLATSDDVDPSVSLRADLLQRYPVREMIKRGWLRPTNGDSLLDQLASFLEIDDPAEIPYLPHAAKKSSYEMREVPAVQLIWLFRARQMAKAMPCASYSTRALKVGIEQLGQLLREPEDVRHVPTILRECGVRLVLIEAVSHSKIDGACFWLDEHSPVVCMSMRYDRIDNFWFVLRHELEHVLCKHGMDTEVLDDFDDQMSASGGLPEIERIANAAAATFCVPADKLDSFIKRKHPLYYERDVLLFSKLHGIHPGIVVGQMQRRLNRYDYLRKYQVKVRQYILPGAMADGWGQTILL
jgi:HTH-type transcriptional regulator/antitoxin HigA